MGMTLILLSRNIIVEKNEKISNTVFLFIGILMVIFAFEIVFYDYKRIYVFVTSFCIGFIFFYSTIVFKNSKVGNYVVCIGFVSILVIYPLFAGIPSSEYHHGKCSDFYEEEILRPRGGDFLEFDRERNILLIGEERGLGLYNPLNNTYKIINLKEVTGIAIDYVYDIYYISTLGNGIKKYFINNNTLINNPFEFHDYKYAYQLAFDEYNNNLVICLPSRLEKDDFIYQFNNNKSIIIDTDEKNVYTENNSALYSSERKILFIYTQHQHLLKIINYNNNTKSINVELDKNIFNESKIENVDIVYDPKFEIVFLGIIYNRNYYLYHDTNRSLVIYNVNNNNISYLNLPKYEFRVSTIVYDICINSESHELYIGSDRGLLIYNISTKNFNRIGSINHKIKSLVFDYKASTLYYSYWTGYFATRFYLKTYNTTNEIIKEIN